MTNPNSFLTSVARVVVVGGSAGATLALRELLHQVHVDVPLVVAIHVGPSIETHDFEWEQTLLGGLNMKLQCVVDKVRLERGCVYVCPADYHVLVEEGGSLALSVDEKVNFCRPSIDVLFESASDAFGEQVLGILLSGANEDGALGVRRIKQCGGIVAIQDPEQAEVGIMPRAGIALTEPDVVGGLQELRRLLLRVQYPEVSGNHDE